MIDEFLDSQQFGLVREFIRTSVNNATAIEFDDVKISVEKCPGYDNVFFRFMMKQDYLEYNLYLMHDGSMQFFVSTIPAKIVDMLYDSKESNPSIAIKDGLQSLKKKIFHCILQHFYEYVL